MMKWKQRGSVLSLLCLSAVVPAFGTNFTLPTYYVGVENTAKPLTTDYDYNDLIFSAAGNGLMLQTIVNAALYSPIVPNEVAPPFWDNQTGDPPAGSHQNFGDCLYVGCPGSTALNTTAQYVAGTTASQLSVPFVFVPDGTVTLQFFLQIESSNISLSWCTVSGNVCTAIAPGPGDVYKGTTASFNPGTSAFYFDLVNTSKGQTLDSNSTFGTSGIVNFAVAGAPGVPEPATLLLVGGALLGIGAFRSFRGRRN